MHDATRPPGHDGTYVVSAPPGARTLAVLVFIAMLVFAAAVAVTGPLTLTGHVRPGPPGPPASQSFAITL